MLKNSKKGVVEILSFVLVTAVIVVASLSTYIFAKSFLEKNVAELDRSNFENKLVLLEQKINSINTFDNSQTFLNIEFKTGSLFFQNNQIIYSSFVETSSNSTFCLDNICSYVVDGFETLSLDISPLQVNQDFLLNPGNYNLFMRFQKNDSTIHITFQ